MSASFEQLPAKCTPHTPRRIKELYSAKEYPTARCSNSGYFTIYSDVRPYTGACCYHRDPICGAGPRGAEEDCVRLKYGQPTSRHAAADARELPGKIASSKSGSSSV